MSIGDEVELEEIRPRTASCELVGIAHENGHSFASVRSRATQLQETDRVIYEIAWDAAVAPVGHEGLYVNEGSASDFVVDKSQDGQAIGDNRDHYSRDGADGRVFQYTDGIEWSELNGGAWRFRLRVENGAGSEVARSDEVTVDWRH